MADERLLTDSELFDLRRAFLSEPRREIGAEATDELVLALLNHIDACPRPAPSPSTGEEETHDA